MTALQARDPRCAQILVLSSLLAFLTLTSDFAPPWWLVFITAGAASIIQIACEYLSGRKRLDIRSAVITSLSLTLLLRATHPAFWVLAAAIGIAGKFLLRVNGKHLFNPAALGIVVCLLAFPGHAWVSPAQWGLSPLFAFAVAGLSILVLAGLRKGDIALFFLLAYAAMIFGRAVWLGDPPAIPLHQLQNGSLWLFSFFMISDPRTTPDHWAGRLAFALAVAAVACIIQFVFFVPEGLFYALILVSPLAVLFDRLWQAETFRWNVPSGTPAATT